MQGSPRANVEGSFGDCFYFCIPFTGPDHDYEPADYSPTKPKVDHHDVQRGLVLAQHRHCDWQKVHHNDECQPVIGAALDEMAEQGPAERGGEHEGGGFSN